MSIPAYLQERGNKLDGIVAASNHGPQERLVLDPKQTRLDSQYFEQTMTPDFEKISKIQDPDKTPIIKLKSTLEPGGRSTLRQSGRVLRTGGAADGFTSAPRTFHRK